MSFLSIIYLETNSTTSEKISVGLLGVAENHIYFKQADNKIKIAEKLKGSSLEKLVKLSLSTIKQQIAIANKDFTENKLFDNNHQFKTEYIKYLSNYSQGLLQFDAPKNILVTLIKLFLNNYSTSLSICLKQSLEGLIFTIK